ncbi:MAG: hypothetical protein O2901_00620 [Verrucomicrobia bacterium]|nr:hypothetical protein [Verrucomicrobiota bacterium]
MMITEILLLASGVALFLAAAVLAGILSRLAQHQEEIQHSRFSKIVKRPS